MNAARFREIFHILHNLDRGDLEQAGVINPNGNGGSDWTRFNNNLTTFVLKLPADRCANLAALIESKQPEPDAYADMLAAMKQLVAQWESFQASDANQEQAYYKLAKHAHPHWESAKTAIAKAEAAS